MSQDDFVLLVFISVYAMRLHPANGPVTIHSVEEAYADSLIAAKAASEAYAPLVT